MKRKATEIDEEEERLSSLLFNKSQKFTENLSTTVNKSHKELDLKPKWLDEDDNQYTLEIIPNVKSKGLYADRLKQKHETLIGTPSWAKLSIESTADAKDEVLRTVGHLKKPKLNNLKKTILDFKSFPTVNSETRNEGPLINSVIFHPKMSVVLVAGRSGVVSLFSIGGDVNDKLHSFCLKKWNISSAQFTPDGTEAFISSKFNHSYCVYNLVKAEPKLLQLPKCVKKPKIFKLSPNGKLLVVSDGFDEVYIICARSKELLRSLKHNGKVQSVVFSHNSEQLYCYECEGNITVWDLSTFRSVKKFYDSGCVTASSISTSSCGKLLATGSGEGIVNIYDTKNITTEMPVPLKTISHLTTKITDLTFNSSTEILAVSSHFCPNAVKLVHIPSYHVFTNFPKQNLNHIQSVSFSPNSGYMALGNNNNCAYLFRLKHFKNY